MKKILIIISFLITTSCFAQDSSLIKLKLKFVVFPFLSLNMPHITGAGEIIIKDKIGLEFGYGRRYLDRSLIEYISEWPDEDNSQYDSLIVPNFGERIHFEMKYYTQIKDPDELEAFHVNNYFGLAFYKIHDIRNKKIEYLVPKNDSIASIYFEHTAIEKKLLIFDFIFGQIHRYKKIEIDSYVLVGLKHHYRDFIQNEYDEKGYDIVYFRNSAFLKPLNGIRPSINFGMKISYKIF